MMAADKSITMQHRVWLGWLYTVVLVLLQCSMMTLSHADNYPRYTDDVQPNPTAQIDYRQQIDFNRPIYDLSQVLSPSAQQQISQLIQQIHQQRQAQIALVIVPTTYDEDIFSYSMDIAQRWRLGQKNSDNGLLIVVATQDQRVQILTGYGLEGVLPDIMLNHIIQQQMIPQFKVGDYATGIYDGVREIQRILSLDPDVARQAVLSLQQEQQAELARSNAMVWAVVIFLVANFIGYAVGVRWAAIGAGGAGLLTSLLMGVGFSMALVVAAVLFILIFSSLSRLIVNVGLTVLSSGSSSSGGGGGYSGGGGSFGGGGASGSW